MGEEQGSSTREHDKIMCEKCKVYMLVEKEELTITFHGEDIWYYYTCPVCKVRYE